MQPIRTFIAIELPDSLKRNLARIQDGLRRIAPSGVKWVSPDSIHITLKFLGNISPDQTSAITQAITQALRGLDPLQLEPNAVGAFPGLRAPRVIWVGLGGDISRLATLQVQVEQALLSLGFPAETRAFSPHLTLGRVRDGATPQEREQLGSAIRLSRIEDPTGFLAQGISFMKSTLTPAGAVYDRIAFVPLDRDMGK